MPLKAVEPRRLYRQIAEQLRELINAGEFPVGGRLPGERELAESLGVSRPTVREALIALEVEGLIRINVGSGIYVTATSSVATRPDAGGIPDGPFEVLYAREIVEASVAAEAAVSADRDHREAIDRVLLCMDRCEERSEEWIALDREFHVAIASALGNGVLARLVGQLFDQRINPYYEHLASYFEDASTRRQAHAEHRAIRDAIAAGDAAAARDAMRVHLRLSQERLSRGFGEPALSPSAAGGERNPAVRPPVSDAGERRTDFRRKQR